MVVIVGNVQLGCIVWWYVLMYKIDEFDNMYINSPLRNTILLLRREWYWIFSASFIVVLVIIINMRSNTGADYSVLAFEPRTLPTLAVMRNMQQQQGWLPRMLTPSDPLIMLPEQFQSAYGALGVVWLLSRILNSPFLLFFASYVVGVLMSTIFAYGALRIGNCNPRWALVGSIAFGILPARFLWPDLAAQWFVVMPMIGGCIFALWYRPHLLDWRYWVWYDWVFMGLLAVLTTAFGKSESYTMVLVCFLVAGMYVAETQTWRPAAMILSIAMSAWCMVQLQTWWMPHVQSVQVSDFQGISLAAMVLPPPQYIIPSIAVFGAKLALIANSHNHTYYIGLLAVAGVVVLLWRGIVILVDSKTSISAQRATAVIVMVLVIANQASIGRVLVWSGLLPFTQWEYASIWIAFLGIHTIVFALQHNEWLVRRYELPLIVLMVVGIVCDQMPQTTVLKQLPTSVQLVDSPNWHTGLFFSQAKLPADIIAVQGLANIDNGNGRWSAPYTTQVVVQMNARIDTPVTIHLRAKTDTAHAGLHVPIQLGDEVHTITLSSSIQEYVIDFNTDSNATQLVVNVPGGISEDPCACRGFVFMQSLWVDDIH